jgi:hypothetical protein
MFSTKTRFVRPTTHNKVILGCRALDQDLNDNGAKHYKCMPEKIIRTVDQYIQSHLEVQSTITHQHLSIDGSSCAPSTRASR